jgi:drug/metabolite transporter (DMT)-like permease
MVAALFILAFAWGLQRARSAARTEISRPTRHTDLDPLRWLALVYVAVVGGGLAFVLFFDGLAKTTATPAAFWRDTLLVWVALLAVPLLRERLAWWNVAAIVLLITGQVAFAGGFGHLAADQGELLVLASSLLWAFEVVAAKVLLRDLTPTTLSLLRMGGGALTLLVYLGVTGRLQPLASLSPHQLAWVLLTGLLLAAYVLTWMTALARGRAVDVTSVLVGGALVTWLLQALAGTASTGVRSLGLALVAAGTAMTLWAVARHRLPGRSSPVLR